MLIVRWMILDDFGTSVYMPHAQRVAQWQLLCCLPRLLEVWIEAQRPKTQFRRVFQHRFLVSVSWRQLSGFQTTATQAMSALCGMSSHRHVTCKYLQDPKKWLLSILGHWFNGETPYLWMRCCMLPAADWRSYRSTTMRCSRCDERWFLWRWVPVEDFADDKSVTDCTWFRGSILDKKRGGFLIPECKTFLISAISVPR